MSARIATPRLKNVLSASKFELELSTQKPWRNLYRGVTTNRRLEGAESVTCTPLWKDT